MSMGCRARGWSISDMGDKRWQRLWQKQASTLAYMSAFNFLNPPAVKLAEKFDQLTPSPLSRFFFSNSGAEAVESALAIARQYHFNRGDKGRYKIISRRGSYHGSTFGGKSVSGLRHDSLQARFAPLLEGTIHVAGPDTYRPFEGMDIQQLQSPLRP